MVPLHPKREMTLVYKMAIDYDPYAIDAPVASVDPTFWLNATDAVAKKRMQLGLKEGKTYRIAPPFMEARDGGIFLPIIEGEKL